MPAMTATLTTNGTVYNLYTLIKVSFPNAAGACRELLVGSDAGNGAGKIYVGGNDVSSTNYGVLLLASQSETIRSDRNNVPISNMAVTSDTDGAKINLQWEYA